MRESAKERPLLRTTRTGTSVAVYGDVSRADHMILRGPARGLDLLAVYLTAGRVVAAVCIGQTAETERLIEHAVADGAVPIANLANPDVSLENAFLSPAAAPRAA